MMPATSPSPSRRSLLAGAVATSTFGILTGRASAAEFRCRLATGQAPSHPVNVRAQEAADRIRKATGGRMDIRIFPANQLGSDTELLTQLREGRLEFLNLASSVLATFVPVAGIVNTGFAFADYGAVWKAMDGELGQYLRAEIGKTAIFSLGRAWDNGFRHITSSDRPIREPDDLKGFRIRVPKAPILTSLFTALGAAPAEMNFNEVYAALQTRDMEGQENALAIVATARLYEVQRFCSLTGHVWDAYWLLGSRGAWERLPPDIRTVVAEEFDRSAADQRADVAALSDSLRLTLAGEGMTLLDIDRDAFRRSLTATSFYRDWKERFGEEAWSFLERMSGKLA